MVLRALLESAQLKTSVHVIGDLQDQAAMTLLLKVS